MSTQLTAEERNRREHDHDQDHAIRIALLEQAMAGIKSELHGINANIGKLIWVVIATLGASVVQFIIKGGLNVIVQ